jgi:hypothetical protein
MGEGVERRRWLTARRRQVHILADQNPARLEEAMHLPQSQPSRGEVK